MNRNDNGEKQLETREVEASTTTVMVLPTDILMGQGATRYNNPGNVAFRELIKEHVVQYEKDAPRKEKAALVKLLISKIDEKGHRFLHESPAGTWVEASSEKAKKKVAHALRDARLKLTKNGGNGTVLPTNVLPDSSEPRPTGKDIMLGRGATRYNTPGNEVYRKLVEEKVDEYNGKANRTEKPAFVTSLISDMKTKGYRFLHRSENGSLVEAPVEHVNEKVPHDFRNALARRTTKDTRDETSDNTAVIETVVQTQCQTTPTEEFPPAEGESQEAEVSTSEMEPRLEQCDGSSEDMKDAAYGARHFDDVGIPLDIDARVVDESPSSCFTDDPYEPLPFDSEPEESVLCGMNFLKELFARSSDYLVTHSATWKTPLRFLMQQKTRPVGNLARRRPDQCLLLRMTVNPSPHRLIFFINCSKPDLTRNLSDSRFYHR